MKGECQCAVALLSVTQRQYLDRELRGLLRCQLLPFKQPFPQRDSLALSASQPRLPSHEPLHTHIHTPIVSLLKRLSAEGEKWSCMVRSEKRYIVMGLSPCFNKVEQKASGQQTHQHYLNGGTSSYSITWLTGKMNLGNSAHRGSS